MLAKWIFGEIRPRKIRSSGNVTNRWTVSPEKIVSA
jgi:hypothetical protein